MLRAVSSDIKIALVFAEERANPNREIGGDKWTLVLFQGTD